MFSNPGSVLAVIAHPDDLELMAGGAVAKWVAQKTKVHVLTLTNGVWAGPDGKPVRDAAIARAEAEAAAEWLGYTHEILDFPAMELKFEDRLVVEVLKRLDTHNADTILCPWEGDLHHDHEVVCRIAQSASRRVPRVLMGQINYYLRSTPFVPNVFVDISAEWETKVEAVQKYAGEWSRAGDDWLNFMDATSRFYGRMIGVERAEGFVSHKFLMG